MITTNTSDNYVFEKSIEVYPNPTSSVLKIKTSDMVDNLKVMDLLGRTYLVEDGNKKEISVQSRSPGIYILSVSFFEKGTSYVRFLKQD